MKTLFVRPVSTVDMYTIGCWMLSERILLSMLMFIYPFQAMDPNAIADGQQRMQKLFKE